MKKLLLCIFFSFLLASCLLPLASSVSAANEFVTDFRSTYEISAGGNATITHNISLTNQEANIFASEYAIIVGTTNIKEIKAYDQNGTLPIDTLAADNNTSIKVKLDAKPLVGKGKVKKLTIQYKSSDIATIVGKVLELNIPKIANSDSFNTYQTAIIVPKKFGPASNIIPEPQATKETAAANIIEYQKPQLTTGITAVFGTSQLFTAKLTYYLENQSAKKAIFPLALIPDTDLQKVTYSNIEPHPQNLSRDSDGNWLADYHLTPGQKIQINVSLNIETFMLPLDGWNKNTSFDQKPYLSPTAFWPINDPEIIALAKEHPTPESIYNFVTNQLKYDYLLAQKEHSRKGATNALHAPEESICTEFTDLFIAIARAAGIPSREVNGFAYTQNPRLRPLSLSKDILHAWPEYWDGQKQRWVQVDPTWGHTTGGIDYFHKLDLNHIAFVIHGLSDESPSPAGFYKTESSPSKTIFIEPVSFIIQPVNNLESSVEIPQEFPTLFNSRVILHLKNLGNQAIYRLPISVETPYRLQKTFSSPVEYLLPGQTLDLVFNLRPLNLWSHQKDQLTIAVSDKIRTYDTLAVPLFTRKQTVALLALFALASSTGFAICIWRLRLFRRKK